MIYLIQYLELINLILHSFMSWSLYAFYYNQYFYRLLNFCLSYKGKKWKIKCCPYTYFHNKDVRFVQKNCRWYIEKRFFFFKFQNVPIVSFPCLGAQEKKAQRHVFFLNCTYFSIIVCIEYPPLIVEFILSLQSPCPRLTKQHYSHTCLSFHRQPSSINFHLNLNLSNRFSHYTSLYVLLTLDNSMTK